MKSLSRLLIGLCVCATSALAQYPAKPIRVTCSVPVGSSGDIALRLMTAKMTQQMGQPLVIETSTAAGGTVAARNMMKAAPDGYSFLYASSGSMIGAIYLNKDVGYDPIKDFTPLSQVAEGGSFLAVSASLPVNTLQELIDYGRKNPGKLSYGSNGIGSNFHMQGEAFKMATGLDILHVPYSGGNMAIPINDLMTGRLDIHFPSFSLIGPHLSTGKVKLLAVMGQKRVKRMPDVAPVSDTVPSFRAPPSWFAAFGPPGMAQPLAARLQSEMGRAMSDPEVSGKLNDIGITPWGTTQEQFVAMLKSDMEIMAGLVAKLGIKPQ
jgi:tripartite-type tricarboxylate transporter receptor subunit TctC